MRVLGENKNRYREQRKLSYKELVRVKAITIRAGRPSTRAERKLWPMPC